MDPASHRTVLCTPLGLNLAEVTRMIQVAQALPRTVEPVFLVHDAGFDHLVDRAGLRRVPGERPFTAREAAQVMAFDQGRTPRHPFTYEVVHRRVQREREASRAVGAVAVVHGTNPTSTLSARAEAVPLFYPVPYAWSTPMLRGGRPLPLLADRGLGHVVNRVLTPPVRHAMTASHLLVPGSFRRVAAGAGVRLDSPMDLLGADVTLLTCTEDEVTGALPPDTHVVGPIFAHLDAEIPALVHELAASDRPLVYMAFGSSGNRPLVLSAMRAVASAPIEGVAPVRQYLRAGDEAPVPHNVHVVDPLPAHRLGPLGDAAILHGGQGTVQTA